MEPIAARIIPLTTDIEISRGTKTNSTWEAIVIESPEAALDLSKRLEILAKSLMEQKK